MHGNVTDQEWLIFREAYLFFKTYCNPPAHQSENSTEWWIDAAQHVCEIDQRWKDYPLMRELLMAVYSYLEIKSKECTKEIAEFDQI